MLLGLRPWFDGNIGGSGILLCIVSLESGVSGSDL